MMIIIMIIFFIYRSFEAFVDACIELNNGTATLESFDHLLATIGTTYRTTAILEAGRISLNEGGRSVTIAYEDEQNYCQPTRLI